MTRPDPRQVFDTENLQADVMRFMAIIAFCLIAILALVQKLDQAGIDEAVMPLPSVLPAPAPPVPPPPATPTIETKSIKTTSMAPALEDKTLTLRFASDAAFLSLLGRQRVVLYGKVGPGFQKLTTSFALEPVQLRGDLYEVMESSLPAAVKTIFSRRASPDTFLVSLPDETAVQISSLRSTHAAEGGELLINEKGTVRYENVD